MPIQRRRAAGSIRDSRSRSPAAAGFIAIITAFLVSACQPAPAPRPLTAMDVVQRATETARTLETVQIVLTVEGVTAPIANGLGLTRAEGRLKRPNDAQLKLRLMFGTSTLETELRAYDGRTYVRNPLGARYEELSGTARIALLDPESGMASVMPTIIEPKLLEPQTESGIKHQAVQGQLPSTSVSKLIGGTATGNSILVDALVRETDWQLARLRLAGAALQGDQPEAVRVITLSEWNEPVTIPPLPTPGSAT
ncbi:MAG: LppX_LprAFG lipoprotein [Chloroflexota bacterium]